MKQHTINYTTNNGFTKVKITFKGKQDFDKKVYQDVANLFKAGKVKIFQDGYSGKFWCFDNKVYEDQKIWYENVKFNNVWANYNGKETPCKIHITGTLFLAR